VEAGRAGVVLLAKLHCVRACGRAAAGRKEIVTEVTLEQVEELYEFLMGNPPKEVFLTRLTQPKLTARKAFSVILFLQERLHLLPDKFEQCPRCLNLFNADCEGHMGTKTDRLYCDSCEGH
jgi:hypothetical protein